MEQKNKKLVSVEDAANNFQEVIEMVEQNGSVVLGKDNNPMYVITKVQNSSDKKIMSVASEILNKHKRAFEELGQ